jgi:hypothetical protein
VGIEFPVVKLRDYAARWDALEASDNPFAMVVMAHLQARATRRDPEGRLQWKLRLEQASPQELESWAERVLEAQRLEDVLASAPAS